MSRLERSRQRGSLLITAMILSAVIAISLASYLRLSRTTLQLSNRALYSNGAMNLAENGLEEAMYSINRMISDSTYSWSDDGWTVSGSNARRKWTGTTFAQNTTGEVRVYVYNHDGTGSPKIISRAIVTLAGNNSPPIEKWIEVQLRKTSKFANGLVAKDQIRFSGNNASVDSWNSNPDNDPSTPPVPYSAGVRKDNGSVGSVSVAVDAVAVQNADIWGYVATGGSPPSVGSNGLIGPFGTPSGTVNPNRVSTDFVANFENVTAPSTTYTIPAITNTLTLPRGSDTASADGKYYYTTPYIDFNNKTLHISAKVVLVLTNTATSISIGGGSGMLSVASGSQVEIYAPGDVSIAGNGILNGGTTAATANPPSAVQIWGTKTSGIEQSISIAGNGVLSALVYAPYAGVRINGNGDVCGSIVADNITIVGNAAMHYDEALGNFEGVNPYRATRWNELSSAAERAIYTTALTF
jgi:Tfp pilus assembly protein PilV